MPKEQRTKDDVVIKKDIMDHVIKQTKALKGPRKDCWTRQLSPLTQPLETPNSTQPVGSLQTQYTGNMINQPIMSETNSGLSQQSTGEKDIGAQISELYRLINGL